MATSWPIMAIDDVKVYHCDTGFYRHRFLAPYLRTHSAASNYKPQARDDTGY